MNTATESKIRQEATSWGKILIVEDNDITCEWLARLCAKMSLATVVCKTKGEALEALAKEGFHAVITDLFLQSSTEPEGIEIINFANTQGTPSIVITANLNSQVAKESLNHGALYLLEKPFKAEDLQGALNTIWNEPRGLVGISERFFDQNRLTPKEKKVARLSIKGLSIHEMASVESVSEKTIKAHLTSIFSKCGIKSRTELLNAAIPF